MRRVRRFLLVLCAAVLYASSALAAYNYKDERFAGVFTTENLDAIIEAYELYDGWYWTTPADTLQDYHGVPECPGWTDTAVNRYHRHAFREGWYGCRWGEDEVASYSPNTGGYGECFGFAQFIGYLLSGEPNPHKNWKTYYSRKGKSAVEAAGGLRVGDIVRVEYRANGSTFQHSAVVYAVNGEEVLFLQISSIRYNLISVGKGFSDGNHIDETNPDVIAEIPGVKICRSQLNLE